MKHLLWVAVILCSVVWLAACSEAPGFEVRYLGANGWAVTVGNRLLIFDYQEGTDPSPPSANERDLDHGYINPSEIEGLDVYVFVTHSHFDHYDTTILSWEHQLDCVTYLFGWQAANDASDYYFDEWRESAVVDSMEVYTIYSHHSGVPEVAFLVLVDGIVLYHNGDYRADFEEDYDYLRTITDRIDAAFVIGHPYPEHQYFQQTLLLTERFDVGWIFPMNVEGESNRCHQYAAMLIDHGVEVPILVAETRGDVLELE